MEIEISFGFSLENFGYDNAGTQVDGLRPFKSYEGDNLLPVFFKNSRALPLHQAARLGNAATLHAGSTVFTRP